MKKTNDIIIDRIQKLNDLGLSQDEIAYELRISQATVNKYLKKEKNYEQKIRKKK